MPETESGIEPEIKPLSLAQKLNQALGKPLDATPLTTEQIKKIRLTDMGDTSREKVWDLLEKMSEERRRQGGLKVIRKKAEEGLTAIKEKTDKAFREMLER